MLSASFPGIRRILCLGAHADDVEIGCGGALLKLIASVPEVHVDWVVFSAHGVRRQEAQASARKFLDGSQSPNVILENFRDAYFPYMGGQLKECFDDLKRQVQPDVVFTHYGQDLHQDHREVSNLTWNTFRDHLILEYEIPKYDGGLGSPNFFVHLSPDERQRKIDILLDEFPSQRVKPWFSADTFAAVMRLRGIESNAPSGFAEAFYCRKVCCDLAMSRVDKPRMPDTLRPSGGRLRG
jgi:LmbE family N-acetylglucosaminyl deacetylase